MSRKKQREPETAVIESATHDGKGIAAITGKKVFVAGALPGETVEFIRRKSRRNYDEAELLSVIEPSPDRIEAKCEAFGRWETSSLMKPTSYSGFSMASKNTRLSWFRGMAVVLTYRYCTTGR